MEDLGCVSLILPVYDVEKYLPQCLDSLCNQTYSNLEILIVDDESPDRCGEIADEYAGKDHRIKVLHIQNRGAAGARNVGLDACTGDYVMFVDSDDWLEQNAVERLLVTLKERDADIVQCQYLDEYINESKYHTYTEQSEAGNSHEFLKTMISKWEYVLIWNKIYKAKLLQNIRFVEGRCIDDEFFTYQVILQAEKIVYITDYLYHYRQRKSSAMGNVKKDRQRLRDQVDFITQRYQPLTRAFPQLKVRLLEHMMEVLMTVMRNGASYADVYGYAKKKLFKYGIEALCTSDIKANTRKSVFLYLTKKRSSFMPDKVGCLQNQNYFD